MSGTAMTGPRPYTVSVEGRLEPGRLVIAGLEASRGEKRAVIREELAGSSQSAPFDGRQRRERGDDLQDQHL